MIQCVNSANVKSKHAAFSIMKIFGSLLVMKHRELIIGSHRGSFKPACLPAVENGWHGGPNTSVRVSQLGNPRKLITQMHFAKNRLGADEAIHRLFQLAKASVRQQFHLSCSD